MTDLTQAAITTACAAITIAALTIAWTQRTAARTTAAWTDAANRLAARITDHDNRITELEHKP